MRAEAESRYAWASGAPEQVAPTVFRIPVPIAGGGARAVNVYAYLGEDEVVLIDAGIGGGETRGALEAGLAQLGRSLGEVSAVVVTHVHRDHLQFALELRSEFGTNVLLGEGERESLTVLQAPEYQRFGGQLARARIAGAPDQLLDDIGELFRGLPPEAWPEPDRWISGYDVLEVVGTSVVAIPTPGHTTGHLAFLDRANGLLFSGDCVLPHITPSVGVEPAPHDASLRSYLSSLHALQRLEGVRLMPAHGAAGGDVAARAAEIVLHHEQRLATVLDAVTEHPGTAWEITAAMQWGSRGRPFDDLGHVERLLALEEVQIHLEELHRLGRVRPRDGGHPLVFEIAAQHMERVRL